MLQQDMNDLIRRHLDAEAAGDTAGTVAVYTDDVEHDVIGSPLGKLTGPATAKTFYDHLVEDLKITQMVQTSARYGADFAVVEHDVDAAVPGSFMGIDGHRRDVHFRMVHVWDFTQDRISREQVWLDGGAIAAQLA